jgi:hypothetical protein
LSSRRLLKRSHATFTPFFCTVTAQRTDVVVSESIVQGAAGACFLRAAVRLLLGLSGGKSCFERPSCAVPCQGSRPPLQNNSTQSLPSVSLRRIHIQGGRCCAASTCLALATPRCGAVSSAAASGGTQLPNCHKFPNQAAASAAVFCGAHRPASPLLVLADVRCNSTAAQHVSGTCCCACDFSRAFCRLASFKGIRNGSQPCARSIPSTAANDSRNSLLKTANTCRRKRKQRILSERDAMRDKVAA